MSFWTNNSVLALAGDEDPEAVVSAMAEELALAARFRTPRNSVRHDALDSTRPEPNDLTAPACIVQAMSRPWLFLDLDGVVSPVPTQAKRAEIRENGPPAGHKTWDEAIYDMYVDTRLNEWADSLDDAFDVVWASSWEDNLVRPVAEPLGLPSWPVLPIPITAPKPHSQIGYKARAIARHLDSDPRPFAWCDDFIRRLGRLPKELKHAEMPYLLVSPNSRVGLTTRHIETLLAFAEQATACGE